MSEREDRAVRRWLIGGFVALILIVIISSNVSSWFRAKASSRVWQSQGYDITPSEAFWGAKPLVDRLDIGHDTKEEEEE